MKKILVPTDFSDNANLALQYAVMLAQKSGAEITLLHVYDIFIPIDGTPLMPYAQELLKETSENRLQECAKTFITGNVKCHILSVLGSPAYIIEKVANEKNMELVVMGIRGGSRLSQIVIGSTTTALIRNVQIPVFVIPENTTVQAPDKMIFPYDGKEIPTKATMKPLKEIAEMFDCEILTLNVISELEAKVMDKHYIAREAFHALGNMNYSMHFTESGDVLQSINHFIDEHGVNAVAMIYYPRGFFTRIIMESRTHKMAFYTKKPLLILPEIAD
ncbi:MAG: universal stress protein [Sphingobacteriales bacterium]|nr:MAG: universal stress protein [Sphingobacteriales bacterium]